MTYDIINNSTRPQSQTESQVRAMNSKSHSGTMRSPGIFKHLSTPKMFQYIPDSALHGKFFTLL